MKVKLNNESAHRKIVGLLDCDGELLLRFCDKLASEQNTIRIQTNGVAKLHGHGHLEQINYADRTPIYEGDSITITF